MLRNTEFTGLILEAEAIKVARLKTEGGKIKLLALDRFSLVEELKQHIPEEAGFTEDEDQVFDIESDADSIFGLEDEEDAEGGEEEEISLEDLEAGQEEEDLLDLDMVDEAEVAQTNEVLLYNILMGISPQKVRLGLNIPAGTTIFQIIRDTDFSEVKQKDLTADLEEKLESIYGAPKSSDNYSYEIKEDGSLLLASVDEESALLRLLNSTQEFYNGKVIVEEILPDEIILAGMVRANYKLRDDEITGVIQFSPDKCRIVFMQGNEIWQVSPIINEGTKNKSFLNTIFSKILFQLDTGEVPNLDRIIIANNTLGQEAIDFFKSNFSDIVVGEFQYDEQKFDFEDIDPDSVNAFTTAIGIAWAASRTDTEAFPALSFCPSYIVDRQKIFKLQWHGVVLLLLIFLSPITINYFYQANAHKIESLQSELARTKAQLAEVIPTANSTTQLTSELAELRNKLVLLDTLSKGSREWSTKLRILNDGLRNVHSTWFTSMSDGSGKNKGTFLEGYTLYRNRIPRLVELFGDATLMSVDIDQLREKEIYRFSILVKEFAKDPNQYSPQTPEEIQEILKQ